MSELPDRVAAVVDLAGLLGVTVEHTDEVAGGEACGRVRFIGDVAAFEVWVRWRPGVRPERPRVTWLLYRHHPTPRQGRMKRISYDLAVTWVRTLRHQPWPTNDQSPRGGEQPRGQARQDHRHDR